MFQTHFGRSRVSLPLSRVSTRSPRVEHFTTRSVIDPNVGPGAGEPASKGIPADPYIVLALQESLSLTSCENKLVIGQTEILIKYAHITVMTSRPETNRFRHGT